MEDPKKDEISLIVDTNNESSTGADATDNNNNVDSAVNNKNFSGNNNANNITTLSASALARANSLSLASTSLRNPNHKSPPPNSFNKIITPTLANTNANNSNNNNSAPNTNQAKFHPESASATAANNASRKITIDELRKYFHLPIADVAKKLGTCTTALKKICRKLNITKWPYRQILSLTKSIQSLEMASLSDNLEDAIRLQYQEQIALLHKVIGEVLRNPNKTIEHCSLNDLANAVANANGINPISNKISSKSAQDSSETKEDTELATDATTLPPETNQKHESLNNDQDNNNNASNDKHGKSEAKALSLSSSSDTIINIEEEVERTIRRATEFLAAPKAKPLQSQSTNNIANGASKQATASSQSKRKYSMSLQSAVEANDPQQPSSSSAALSSPPHDTFGSNNNNTNGINVASQNSRSIAASPASSASSHKTLDASPTEKDTPRHTVSNNNSNSNSNTGNIQYPNLNIGTSIVKIHYFDHKPNHWAFYGPVQLPPLQRKKFKPLANNALTRRNVPFMEPDVGSNTTIDFVPQTLVNAFKKSFTETKYVGAIANDLMLYDPCTGVFTGRMDPSLMANGNTNGNGINPRTQYTLPNRSRVYSVSEAANGTHANSAANKEMNTNSSSFVNVQPSMHHMHQVAHAHPPMNTTSLPPPPGASRSSSYVHRDSPMSTIYPPDNNKPHSNVPNSSMGMMYPAPRNMSPEERQHFNLPPQHHYPVLHMPYKQQTSAHGLSQTHTSYTTSPNTHLMDSHLHDKGDDHNDDLHSLTPSVLTDTIHTAMDDHHHNNHNHHHHHDTNGRGNHQGEEVGAGEDGEEEDDEHGTALALSALLSPAPVRTHPHHHHQHLHAHGYHREPHIFQYADDHIHNQDLIHHGDDQDNDNGDYLDDAMDDSHRMDPDLEEDGQAMKKPRLSSFSAISTDSINNHNHHRVDRHNRNLNSGMGTDINHNHTLSHDIAQQDEELPDEDPDDQDDEQREMMRHWMNCDSDVDDEQDDQHMVVASTVQLS